MPLLAVLQKAAIHPKIASLYLYILIISQNIYKQGLDEKWSMSKQGVYKWQKIASLSSFSIIKLQRISNIHIYIHNYVKENPSQLYLIFI